MTSALTFSQASFSFSSQLSLLWSLFQHSDSMLFVSLPQYRNVSQAYAVICPVPVLTFWTQSLLSALKHGNNSLVGSFYAVDARVKKQAFDVELGNHPAEELFLASMVQ